MRGTSAPIEGGEGAMSSFCCCCPSCPNDCVAELSAGVIASKMAAIPRRDALKFIAHDSYDIAKKTISRLFPILVQILRRFFLLALSSILIAVSISISHDYYLDPTL